MAPGLAVHKIIIKYYTGNSSMRIVRNCMPAARYVSWVIVVGNCPSRNVSRLGFAVV
jgi:hypothetical protein